MPLLVRFAQQPARRALGLVISGAGPTLCAVCDSEAASMSVASAMKAVYDEASIASAARHALPASEGARVTHVA
jgi:homoserine kinase